MVTLPLFVFGSLIFGFSLIGTSVILVPLPNDDQRVKKYVRSLVITGLMPFLLGLVLSSGGSPEVGNYLGLMILPCSQNEPCPQPLGWLMMIIIMSLLAMAYFLALYGLVNKKYGVLFILASVLLQMIALPIMLLGPASLILYRTFFLF